MKKYVFGVDVGGTSVKLGLFDTDGVLLEKWQIPTRVCDDENRILQDIADAVQEKRAERGIMLELMGGIGLGFPGAVRPMGPSTSVSTSTGEDFRQGLCWRS